MMWENYSVGKIFIMKNKTLVISLGGSLIIPKKIDIAFLQHFKNIILDYVKKGRKVIIICGGGNVVREYNAALKNAIPGIPSEYLDTMGIELTYVNALLVRNIFEDNAERKIMRNPTEVIPTRKKIIIGCGWKPGCSTDKDAVIAAKTYGVSTIINLSNITHIYDKNPKEFKDARPFKTMAWEELRKIVGNVWNPGAHVPFDPKAVKLGQKWKLELIVMNGKNLKNFNRFLHNEKFVGTRVFDATG